MLGLTIAILVVLILILLLLISIAGGIIEIKNTLVSLAEIEPQPTTTTVMNWPNVK